MEDEYDDPFCEELLLSAICALKNVPYIPTVSPVNRLKKKTKIAKDDRPQILIQLNPEFAFTHPDDFVPMPRSDPRVKIPHLLNEAYCSADIDFFRKVCHQIFDSSIVYLHQYAFGQNNPYGPNERRICGIDALVDYGSTVFNSAPDMVSTIYDAVVGHVSPSGDGRSFLMYKSLVSMTKTSVVMDKEQLTLSSSSGEISLDDDVIKATPDFNLVRLPAKRPLINSYQCIRFTMELNTENKVTKMCQFFKQMMYDPRTKHVKRRKRKSNGRGPNAPEALAAAKEAFALSTAAGGLEAAIAAAKVARKG